MRVKKGEFHTVETQACKLKHNKFSRVSNCIKQTVTKY